MSRWVPCAECGNRYDTDATPFCPRCGSTLRGKDPEQRVPVLADDPRRRRAQMGGAILLFTGLALVSAWGFGLASAGFQPEGSIDSYVGLTGDAPIPAGELQVRVLANGTAAQNASVTLRLPSGSLLREGATDASGWFNASLERQAAVRITVASGNHTLERRAFVAWPNREEVRLDVLRDEPTDDAWLGLEEFHRVAWLVLLVLGGAWLLLAVGGAMALALRLPNAAIAASLPSLAVTSLLFLWTLLVGVAYVGIALLFVLQVAAVAMVASGRASFRRRR